MPEDFDPNKFAAEFVQKNFESLRTLAVSAFKGAKDRIRVHLEQTYAEYIARLVDRYGKGKSFFVRTEPVPLYDFYVPMDLRTQRRTLSQPDADDLGRVAARAIIVGSGGSGKSMMMRHLLYSALRSGWRTPVFFELRQLNHGEESLRAALLNTLRTFGLDVDDEYLELAFKGGHFVVLLDGFDEVTRARRDRVAREIRQLAQQYPTNWVVLSSRHDSTLVGWDEFSLFELAPLTVDRAAALVGKVPYDESVKARFVRDMRRSLFNTHKSFLSNPLLLSIMLLTYNDVADVPRKQSTFYAQAYDALFHRHDALKSGFKRDRLTNLDSQDFARAFAAFCVLTYERREFTFTRPRALEAIDEARITAMMAFDREAFLVDAIQAVCLLVEDGLDVSFAHRSFQEYFVARFITTAPVEMKSALVSRYSQLARSENVMALLFEIDPYIVERDYLLPALAAVRKAIGVFGNVERVHFVRYLRAMYSSISATDIGTGPESVTFVRQESTFGDGCQFAFARFGNSAALPSAGDREERARLMMEALRSDGLDTGRFSLAKVPADGAFVSFLCEGGDRISPAYVQELLRIELEIRERHARTQGTLLQILSTRRQG